MVEKVFFVLGIAVAVILVIVLLMNLWELLVAALVIAGVIFAFVTGSKEDRSEIRRFIFLKGCCFFAGDRSHSRCGGDERGFLRQLAPARDGCSQ